MIGEAFDGLNWGSNRKAARAARDRAADLYTDGWKTYGLFKESLNGNKTYYVFAFSAAEDYEIMPRNPDTHPMGRRLNVHTIHVGMRVAVETMPNYAHPWHSCRGTVKSVTLEPHGVAWAMIEWDDNRPLPSPPPEAGIQVQLLRQVPR